MDYTKLNQIFSNYINNPNNSIFLLSMDSSREYASEILEKKEYNGANFNTRKFDINTSINIVYNFFNSFSEELASQFYNIINSKDENGKPYVKFSPKKDNLDKRDIVVHGRAFIFYYEEPIDCFIIAHEMIHKMNESLRQVGDNYFSSSGSYVYSELVSITGEVLLGKYMVDNYYINEFYYNHVRNFRLNSSKNNSKSLIVETELLNLMMHGKSIDENTILNLGKSYDKDSIYYKVLNDTNLVNNVINSIVNSNNLSFISYYQYIIAQIYSDRIINSNNPYDIFMKLNDMISKYGCDYSEVSDYLKNVFSNSEHK